MGEFKDDKMNGRGLYTWASGDRYEGQWKDDKRNGQGIFTWTDGKRYEGEYKDDKRNGQGIYTWANGNRYERASSKIIFNIFMILINTSDIVNDHHLCTNNG